MIQGVKIKQLHFYRDERGKLLEVLRRDDFLFNGFGQVYITTIRPAVIKGWHSHKNQTDNICCIKGCIKLVLYDDREDESSYQELAEFLIGDENPVLVQIPKKVFHALQCLGEEEAVVLNIPDLPYNHENPDKYERDIHNSGIPYNWESIRI